MFRKLEFDIQRDEHRKKARLIVVDVVMSSFDRNQAEQEVAALTAKGVQAHTQDRVDVFRLSPVLHVCLDFPSAESSRARLGTVLA
jgi:hypothetical protein